MNATVAATRWPQRLQRALYRNAPEWLGMLGEIAATRKAFATAEFSPEGRLLSANQDFAEAFGYALDDLVGQPHALLLPAGEANSEAERSLWQRLLRGESVRGNFRRRHRNGDSVWLQAGYCPVLAGGGQPVKVMLYACVISTEVRREAESAAQLAAIDKTMAVITFDPQGHILTCNANFQATFGYRAEELIGRHHRQLVAPDEAASSEYRAFWDKLGSGAFDRGVYRRIAKDGRTVWLEASYNPVFDENGRTVKVVKYATDITERRQRDADVASQLAAINRSQAVIEFALDGTVLDANDNFLRATGYTLGEIRGRHHRMFVDPAESAGPEYQRFWQSLGRGEVAAGRFRRRAKNGSDVWLQASYNPILDPQGRPYKVVKYATDITASLKAMMGEINELAERIAVASKEIASGNNDLAARTESQAASLEETAASMEELTSTVRQNADNARQASDLSRAAYTAAERGNAVVAEMVGAIEAISGTSQRIAEIIGLIDGIAFQTNILALNAAVEAARAGEQGRGFAVVASEVRALAQRSADAARDIKGLIGTSVKSVEAGTERARTANTAVNEIRAAISRVTDLMGEIAAASGEQASGIEQVNKAITQMDEGTQQNAALVEEASAASRSLDEQAAALFAAVSAYLR